MRWPIATAIFKKEMLETFRDRRTLAVMLLLPVVLYPLLIVGFGQVVTHQLSALRAAEGQIAVCGELPAALAERFERAGMLVVVTLPETPPPPAALDVVVPEDHDDESYQLPRVSLEQTYQQWAGAVLARKAADCVLVVPQDFQQQLDALASAPLVICYDQTIQKSQTVEQRVVDIVARWQQELREERETQVLAVPSGFSTPLRFHSINIASAQKRGGFMAGRVIPIMLMLMVMLGAFYPAIDLTAGEKERGTMQTLLTAPALASEIIFGKFLTVFCVAMLSAVANLASMALAATWMLRGSQALGEVVFRVELTTLLMLLVQLLPIAVFLSAVMLAVAAFAQSFKEAQNYLTPVYMLILVPSGIAAMPTVTLDAFTAWFPVLNVMLLMRELLLEPPALVLIGMVLIANGLYAALAISLAVRIFQTEAVLLGSAGSFGELFRGESGQGQQLTPLLALGVFALNMVVLFYLGSWMQQAHLLYGMLGTQWLLLLVPAIVLLRALRLPVGSTLRLHVPSLRVVVAAVLLGITAWAVVGQTVHALQEMVLPMPRSFADQMSKALGLQGEALPIWQLLVVFALSPAICEEVWFRGVIMSGFSHRMAKWQTVLLTGVLFGLFHISIYRIVPTAVLGMLIALVVLQTRSLYTGVIVHFCNNATALLLMRYGWLERFGVGGEQPLDWRLVVIAGLVFVTGLALLPWRRQGVGAARRGDLRGLA